MTSAVEIFSYYQSVKLHLTQPDFSAPHYNYKTKAARTFDTRKDRYFFEKLARRADPKGHVLANLTANPSAWIGDLFTKEADKKYFDWKRYQEAQSYYFEQDLNKIPKNAFKVLLGEHPLALKMLLSNQIRIETLAIINAISPFTPTWDRTLGDDIVWDEYRLRLSKYQELIQFDKPKMREILKKWLTSE